jgi:predicted GH43/DUF377 family glycosyl hydrolase
MKHIWTILLMLALVMSLPNLSHAQSPADVEISVDGENGNNVVLRWTPAVGEAYDIYRSTTDPFAGFVLIGHVGPDTGTFVDASGAYSKAFYYVTETGQWEFCRPIIVTNASTDTLFEHQVRVVFDSPEFDFSHCRSEGQDVRFLSFDRSHRLDYWIQFWSSPDTGVVWVEFDTIPASINDTLAWLYYGNARAETESDGAATFIAFSDFDSLFTACGPTDPTQWDSVISRNPATIIPNGPAGAWNDNIREIGNILVDSSLPDTLRYMCFFSGYPDGYNGANPETLYIGMAYSSDGDSWTTYGPVLGSPFEGIAAEDPYAVKVNDTTWYLYYEMRWDAPFCCIGLAISQDTCKSFTEYSENPVLQNGPGWESSDVSSPIVWVEGGTWYMLYEGRTGALGKIGLATSANGKEWSKYSGNPVLQDGPPGAWDDVWVCSGDLVKIGSTYYLFYHGWNGSIVRCGMATSSDLHSWTRYNENPLRSSATDEMMIFRKEDGDWVFHYDDYSSSIKQAYPFKFDTSDWVSTDWDLKPRGSIEGRYYGKDGAILLGGRPSRTSSANIHSVFTLPARGFAIEVKRQVDEAHCLHFSMGHGANLVDESGGSANWYHTTLDSGYFFHMPNTYTSACMIERMPGAVGLSGTYWTATANDFSNTAIHTLVYSDEDSLIWFVNDVEKGKGKDSTYDNQSKKLLITQGEYSNGWGGLQTIEWIFVRRYHYPQPTIILGAEQEN